MPSNRQHHKPTTLFAKISHQLHSARQEFERRGQHYAAQAHDRLKTVSQSVKDSPWTEMASHRLESLGQTFPTVAKPLKAVGNKLSRLAARWEL